jgi:hypothetical protein
VSKEVRDAMEEMGGKIEAYDKVFEGVKGAGKVMCDGRISWALVEAVGEVSESRHSLCGVQGRQPACFRRITLPLCDLPSSWLRRSRTTSRSQDSSVRTSGTGLLGFVSVSLDGDFEVDVSC